MWLLPAVAAALSVSKPAAWVSWALWLAKLTLTWAAVGALPFKLSLAKRFSVPPAFKVALSAAALMAAVGVPSTCTVILAVTQGTAPGSAQIV